MSWFVAPLQWCSGTVWNSYKLCEKRRVEGMGEMTYPSVGCYGELFVRQHVSNCPSGHEDQRT
eukprot:8966273-Pyramimonas_sp.AAC.1